MFCSGEREIRDAADALGDLGLRHTEILPLYARLSAAEQHRVFAPHTGRRIVLATNVAETSLTVPGVRSVVDPGTARISRYSRRTKVQRLPIEPVSQASADQRAGRCGRLGPGVCIRLYDEVDFASRPEFTEPEILRTNLASVILQMAALDLGDVQSFPFLDPPDSRSIRDGIALLHELGAIDPAHEGTRRWLTPIGRQLAMLPLDPRLARMVIEADRNACLREVLVIASALSIQDPRERPADHEEHADQLHARFREEGSDLLGWLRLWSYLHSERRARTSGQFRRLCRDEYLNYRRVREWQDIYSQLREVTKELGFVPNREAADPDLIHLSVLAGLLSHVGRKDPESYEYRGARGARFSISPGSVLFKAAPEWLMAAELVETTRLWAHGVARVQVEWVERVGAHLVSRSHSDPWWDAARGTAVANETVTLYGIPLAADRTVMYGRIDPAAARELFIRHALVAGEWETGHEFVARNRARIDEVLDMEARERRTNLLVDDDTLVAWFAARIPEDATSVRDFDRWWKDVRGDDPNLLDLTVADLIDPAAEPPDETAFPRMWAYGDVELPLEYEFDPASPSDGVTIDVPLAALDRLDPVVFEWNVPGRREELIEALIRSLPKQLRRRFVPIADTVHDVVAALDPSSGTPVEVVRRELARIGGVAIPPDAFDPERLPAHLVPRFRVIGDGGVVLAEGGDLRALKSDLVAEARATISEGEHDLEQTGATSWSFGELPRVVEIGEPGRRTPVYPALVDEGESVGVRLLATPEEQADAMWAGTRRLLLLSLPSPARLLRPLLTDSARRLIRRGPYGAAPEWVDDCLACAVGGLLAGAGGPAWDAVGFDRLLDRVRDDLSDAATEVGRRSLDLLAAYEAAEDALAVVDTERFGDVVADIEAQLDRLVYPGFLSSIGADRVPDVDRYLRAAGYRLERLPENPERDRAHMASIHHLEDELDRLSEALPPMVELVDVAWMLEELRVGLFAQSLGTRGKVSEKRIAEALAEIVA